MGSGHGIKRPRQTKPVPPSPKCAEVLYALISDARYVQDHDDADEAASELGIEDAQQALDMWEDCSRTRRCLKSFLGSSFRTFMSCEE
jgi:hypothetical protein